MLSSVDELCARCANAIVFDAVTVCTVLVHMYALVPHLVFACSFFFLQLMGLKTDLAAVRAEHAAEKQAMKNAADAERCEREERAATLRVYYRMELYAGVSILFGCFATMMGLFALVLARSLVGVFAHRFRGSA